MTYKINREQPFQVLATNFTIGPSSSGYELQISADGVNYTSLFTVGANVTRMVTGVANGGFYKLAGNTGDVTVNWRTQCYDGKGGSGGNADYATSAGTSLNTNLLNGTTAFPSNPNTGDVVAIGTTPSRGLRAPVPEAGVYQYDGSTWNKIGENSGSSSTSAYNIELSTSNPDGFTEEDIDNLNDFYAQLEEDPSIAYTAYVNVGENIYHLSYAHIDTENGEAEFSFVLALDNDIETIYLVYAGGEYDYGENHYANITDGKILYSVSEFPESGDKGDVIALSKPYELVSGITVDNGIYQDGVTGKTFTIPIGDYSELPEEGYRLGAVRAIFEDYEGDNYDMTIFANDDDGVIFCIGDASDPNESIAMTSEAEGEDAIVGGVLFRYYNYEDNMILQVYPSTEDNAETVVFTDVPNSILGMYQYNGAEWQDLINPKRLLPDWNANEDANCLFRVSPYFPDVVQKVHERDVVMDGINEMIPYDESKGNNQVFTRTDNWTYKWQQLKFYEMEARTELPTAAKIGNVYAYSGTSGVSLAQVYSGHSGQSWFNFESTTVPTGFTKIRVPYNDDGESNLSHFKTDPNGEGEWSLYWHPEDPNDRHWDGVPEGYSQNDGEFNSVDQWGNTMVAVKVGNYIEVTFGAGVVNGDEDMTTYRNTEVYADSIIADYKEFATVDYVNNTLGNIESILQSI